MIIDRYKTPYTILHEELSIPAFGLAFAFASPVLHVIYDPLEPLYESYPQDGK